MKTALCTLSQAPEILEILNEAIAHSTALYDYKPRTMAAMEAWFDAKKKGNYPILGAFDQDGSLAGFSSFGSFRAWPAYRYSIEHSVYVRQDLRGRGIGKMLLASIVEAAKEQDYHMMIGGVDSENTASIHLHLSLGFTHCASIKHAGFKFNRWLDLEFYQLILPTPSIPREE